MRRIALFYFVILTLHAVLLSTILLHNVRIVDKFFLLVDLLSLVLFPMTGILLRKWFSNKRRSAAVLMSLVITALIFSFFLFKSIYHHGAFHFSMYTVFAGLIFLWTLVNVYSIASNKTNQQNNV